MSKVCYGQIGWVGAVEAVEAGEAVLEEWNLAKLPILIYAVMVASMEVQVQDGLFVQDYKKL